MNYIKQKLEIGKEVAFVTYKEWSAFRTHSMISIFVGPVYFLVQYFIWTAVYGNSGTLNGIGLESMIRYFGAAVLIGYLTMDFADWNLNMLVRTGKFLTFALRPIHHRYFALSQKFGHRVLGFFFEFLPCLLILVLFFRVNMMPANLLGTILSVTMAFFMNFYINYCLGLVSFFLVSSDGIRSVYKAIGSVFSGSLIPLAFFPHWLQLVQFFLPFQYTVYIPAMVWTGQYDLGYHSFTLGTILLLQFFALIALITLSEFIYRLAMKRFTGVGA